MKRTIDSIITDEENLESLTCAIAMDNHFIQQPIGISCGHSICRNCVPENDKEFLDIKCCICNEMNIIDNLKLIKESIPAKKLFSVYLNELFPIMHHRFDASFKDLKDVVENVNLRIDKMVDFAREDIILRIESMKIELDKLSETLIKELASYKEELVKQTEVDEQKYEFLLKELTNTLKSKKEQDEAVFYQYQNELKNLNHIVDRLRNFTHQISFKPNEMRLSSKLVGKIECNYFKIQNKLDIGVFENIRLNAKPFEICALPNGHLVSINHDPKCITVYDMINEFKLIKKIDKIGKNEISDFYMATNNLDRIYLSDSKNHKIIMTDFNFNVLKEFGTKGTGLNCFDTPSGLCFNQNNLYICDTKNKRIMMLDSTLSFSKIFCPLNFNPWQIKIIYFTACIKELNTDKVHFYNCYVDGLEFEQKHTDANGPICKIKQKTYLSLTKRINNTFAIKFYDDYGDLKQSYEIKNPYLNEYGVDQSMKIECFNETLIISLYESGRLLLFKKN